MATLSVDQVADLVYAVGLRGDPAVVATALTVPESGRVTDKQGDLDRVGEPTADNRHWGPSVGLWQVRSIIEERGSGRTRDELALADAPHNTKAMYEISGGGTNWRPWTAFTNGSYRRYLEEAKRAVEERESLGGEGSIAGGGSSDAALGRSPDTVVPPGSISLAYTPPRQLTTLRIEGLADEPQRVGQYITGGRVELASEESSEVTLELLDPRRQLASRVAGASLGLMKWTGIEMRVVGIELTELDGIPALRLVARPDGVARLKHPLKAAGSWAVKNMSPTEYAGYWAGRVGLRFSGQGSARRTDIAPVEKGDGLVESIWEVLVRLARELGYLLFEAGGVLHFGKPSWLVLKGTEVKVALRRGAWGDPALNAFGVPSERRNDDAKAATLSVQLPRWRGEQVRPGMALLTLGWSSKTPDRWLVTRVSWPVDGAIEPVVVEAVEPVDPPVTGDTLQTAGGPTGGGVPPLTPEGTGGATLSALDMVDECLRVIGTPYVFGAEASAGDPAPDAFDCSELIEWACARIGLRFVDGSYDQWRACKAVTVAEAANIRGALLFIGDGVGTGRDAITHVAVSLGDGNGTVEAKGRAYGVVRATIAGRFNFAGVIPGLRYGSGALVQAA